MIRLNLAKSESKPRNKKQKYILFRTIPNYNRIIVETIVPLLNVLLVGIDILRKSGGTKL